MPEGWPGTRGGAQARAEMTTHEAASTAGSLPFDTSKAHQVRIYDYLLG